MNMQRVKTFILWTFLCSWLFVFLFLSLGGQWNSTGSLIVSVIYMFIPMTVALILYRFKYHEPVISRLQVKFHLNRWFLVAWLIPPILAFVTFGVNLLFPQVSYSPGMAGMFERFSHLLTPEKLEQMKVQAENFPVSPIWIALGQGLIAGITINAVAGFGEELGWRGFLQHELAPIGFWRSSLIIGSIWGFWHAPLILQGHNYPQHPIVGVVMMIVWCMLLTPLMSYIRIKAKSVITAAIFHGTLNGTVGLAIMYLQGGNDLTTGMTGFAGFLVLILAIVGMNIYDRYFATERILHGSLSHLV